MNRKSFLRSLPILGITSGVTLIGCSTGAGVGSNSETELTGDNLVLNQAAEREAIAIQTYNAAADSGIITDQTLLNRAGDYKNHHIEHLELFNDLLIQADGDSVSVNDFGPDQRINDVSSEEEAILLAMQLEMEAANSYFTSSIRDLQGPNAKLVMGSIFPIEVAHFVSLKEALGRNPAVNSAVFTSLNNE